jgi:hypothetical protein
MLEGSEAGRHDERRSGMLQFKRVPAEAEDGLLEKFAANVDYGSEEMVVAQANELHDWVRANCTGIAWVELLKHVEYRSLHAAGFTPDEAEWELSLLFNDLEDAHKFERAFPVVESFGDA